MSRMFRIGLWIGIIGAGLATRLPAVEPYTPTYVDPATEPWRWQVYDDPDFRDAECLFKASNGVLWIGSLKGVVRYDGKTRTRFGESEGFYWKIPRQFQEAPDGTIYYCTSKTIHAFINGTWKPIITFEANAPEQIKFLILNARDQLWVGLNVGILQIQRDMKTLWISPQNQSLLVLKKRFNRIFLIGSDTSLPPSQHRETPQYSSESFNNACKSKDGALWVYSTRKKLYRLECSTEEIQWTTYKIPSPFRKVSPVKQMIAAQDGTIWFVSTDSKNQISRFDPLKNQWESMGSKIPFKISDQQYAISQSLDGTLWISGENNLLSYKAGQWKKVQNDVLPIPDPQISHLSTEANNTLWLIFRKKGVARLNLSSSRWLTYQGLHFQAEDPNGNQWFISKNNRAIYKQQDQWHAFDQGDGLMGAPSAIFITQSGSVWAVGHHNNIAAVSLFHQGRWHTDIHQNFSIEMQPQSIFEGKEGQIWFGSGHQRNKQHKGGLLAYQPGGTGKQRPFKRFGNPNTDIYQNFGIAQEADGAIVVGGQLKRMVDGQLETYQPVPSMPPRVIYVLQEAKNIWMLTGRFDLFFKRGDQITHFKSPDSTIDREVFSFLSWGEKTLWTATSQGIYCFNNQAWTQHVLHKSLAESVNIGSLRSSNNNMLWLNLKTPGSLSNRPSKLFRTVRYQASQATPDTHLFQFPKNVRHQQNDDQFFAWKGSDLWDKTAADDLQFSYRLNADPWSPFSNEKQCVFTGMPIGHHRFEVRARNRDLNIDPTPAFVEFQIIGSVWKQPWFLLGLSSLLGIIVYLLLRLFHAHELRITEKVKFEKEQVQQKHQADLFRLEFFTNISHELRTPLTLIMGPLERLTQAVDTPKLNEQIQIINRNAHRLLNLVNQLLEMRKLQKDRVKLECMTGDLFEFIRTETGSFSSFAEEKGFSLRVDLPKEPQIAQFDPEKLRKILTNLISNAAKFTPDQGELLVQALRSGSKVRINVTDSGPGIDPAYHQLIFNRFDQGPASFTAQSGSGIGLALTKELVELHGGTIQVKSPIYIDQPKAYGTTFSVQLPLTQNPATLENITRKAPEALPSPAQTAETNSLGKYRILLIEDDPDMRRFIQLELEDDYTISLAADGREGVDLALKIIPDLIISDIMMPRMNGIEVCAILKDRLATSHIPIIFLTAKGSQASQIEGFEQGADDYITKPFGPALLKARIKNLLEMRRKLQVRFSEQIDIKPDEVTVSIKDAAFLEKAIHVIDNNLEDIHFDREAFAQEMGISRTGLYTKLKAITGQSINLFIRSVRLKRASELLMNDQLTVGEVADKTGFSSQQYFTNCFTKEFGESPLKHIQIHKK